MVLVRRLTAEDAAAYRTIRLEGLLNAPESFGSSYEEEVDSPLSRTADYLGGSSNFCFGAFDDDGRIRGTANFYVGGALKTRHRGHVVAVYVDPKARGTGVGKALFETLIAAARHEVKQLHLVVTQENEAALRLYQRMGFVIYGEDPRGIKVGDRYYDDYLMVLRLDEGSAESEV
jgi:ribosomal protein S18 acetylase RimI-like enzyme